MVGLTEKDMQAVVNNYNLNDFYYPTLFPMKEMSTLTWKSLEIQAGLHIAGDLVARGASLDPKTREAVSRLQGDMPKVAVKRIMDENTLNEYDIMVAMSSGNANLRQLIEVWAEDTKFCFDGVAARLEWVALQSISKGKVTLTNANNSSVITEYDMDYALPTSHKSGYLTGSTSWETSASAKPISVDMKGVVKAAKAAGISLKYAFMNDSTFAKFCECDEVVRMSASVVQNLAGLTYTPSLEQVNSMLSKLPYMNGMQIVVIDQQVTIEINGTRTTCNPFADDIVMYSESQVLGNTFWKAPADMKLQGSAAYKVMSGHTCIKKYSNEEPIEEVTVGIANAMPAWINSGRCYLQNVTHSDWQ